MYNYTRSQTVTALQRLNMGALVKIPSRIAQDINRGIMQDGMCRVIPTHVQDFSECSWDITEEN